MLHLWSKKKIGTKEKWLESIADFGSPVNSPIII
jgi:hypothetical protein